MQSNRARALIGVGMIAVIVVLFIVLSGGDDESSTTTTTQAQTTTSPSGATGATGATGADESPAPPKPPTIVVQGGKPRGGVERLEFSSGDRIRFVVRSDVADEVHVHGYDISRDVAAGGSVRFAFPADIEGVFEVELEGRHEQIAELRVTP